MLGTYTPERFLRAHDRLSHRIMLVSNFEDQSEQDAAKRCKLVATKNELFHRRSGHSRREEFRALAS
jgi:hypothetical protein